MKSKNLNIPIYLNQQIVFDLLAILEDGFSKFRAVKSQSMDSESKNSEASGSLNASNLFSLLGVSLSGKLGKSSKNDNTQEFSEERVHTPASLFSKLKTTLQEQSEINFVSLEALQENEIGTGDFVEFEGVLRKNPMVNTMEIFVKVFESFIPLTDQTQAKARNNGRKQHNESEIILEQMKTVLNDLTRSKSVDLVVDLDNGVKAVLSCNLEYFNEQDAHEIIDGKFKVLGKVIRVVKSENEESINLLRKTSFGIFNTDVMSSLVESFKGLSESGINMPDLVTEIKGPSIQVIPIAIYA
ncbi:hypothetical protein OIN60_15485 [Paenibacillus sp. P96]|uniref:Uncharacterized protein n=1 Tax=Paenibacillus zeirhizosphaerae TaxID=2987519 RepID=A0ABT9FTY3_9BACL|nr:hypothetical protein [Paenibacillus sp. P96]MDP4098160.1 hypothetical protein [Paenibacillus sp. P96]